MPGTNRRKRSKSRRIKTTCGFALRSQAVIKKIWINGAVVSGRKSVVWCNSFLQYAAENVY